MIRAGRVMVNGQVAKLGDKANPDFDQIKIDGRLLSLHDQKFLYIMLHKPKGVISSLADELEQERTTVRDLIELPGHFYPVGRLDKPSEGLMLMTNDGQLAHKLTHPRYEHEKQYEVSLQGAMSDAVIDQWRRGVMLDGRLTARAPIEVLERGSNYTRLRVILREGRKRQIRRIAAQFGHPVTRLLRERIGTLRLGQLPPGQWRYLSLFEIKELRKSVEADMEPTLAAKAAAKTAPTKATKQQSSAKRRR
jgi:pseudouridine synthase